jgi:hypothetical protein
MRRDRNHEALQMSKLKNEFDTAEAWLRAAVDALRPDFEAIGKTLPATIRGDFGFTSHGSKKTGISGQYYEGSASTDDVPKLIIRCNTDDPIAILEAVVHQAVHAVVGVKEGHGKAFREVGLRMGLEPPMRTSKAGKRLSERLHALAADLGPFPNARLNFETTGADGKEKRVADRPKKQETRQLRVECLVDGCGYCARASAKWLRIGLPLCPVHQEPMHPEKPLPEDDGDQEEGLRDDESPEAESTEES